MSADGIPSASSFFTIQRLGSAAKMVSWFRQNSQNLHKTWQHPKQPFSIITNNLLHLALAFACCYKLHAVNKIVRQHFGLYINEKVTFAIMTQNLVYEIVYFRLWHHFVLTMTCQNGPVHQCNGYNGAVLFVCGGKIISFFPPWCGGCLWWKYGHLLSRSK